MAASSITELQYALDSLLLQKDRLPKPTTYPKWTGQFRLFDFPLELRENIYFHVLYTPKAYTHSISHNVFPFEDPTYLSLFLTCKDVYVEARQVFYRFNAIKIQYKHLLSSTLRLFPIESRVMVQKLILDCRSPRGLRLKPRDQRLSGAWMQMTIEARIAKEAFPSLRQCIMVWYPGNWEFGFWDRDEGLQVLDVSQEERRKVFLQWLKKSYEEDGFKPPAWLQVQFRRYNSIDPDGLQESFGEALEAFKKELKEVEAAGLEMQEDDLKTSRRLWVESVLRDDQETSKKKKRTKRQGNLQE